MNSALIYLLRASLLGGVKQRLSRLKQPKYLLPALFGVAYFGLVLVPTILRSERSGSDRFLEILSTAFPLMIAAGVALWPLVDFSRKGLGFTEVEGELLFAAPLSREELVRFHFLKLQPALLFTSTIASVFSVMFLSPSNLFFFWISLFLFMNLYKTYDLASGLLLTSQSNLIKSILVRLIPFLILMPAIWIDVTQLEQFQWLSPEQRFGVALPTWYPELILAPFKAVANGAFGGSFSTLLPGVGWMLGLSLLFYQLSLRLDTALEEATFETAKRGEALKKRRLDPGMVKNPEKARKALLNLATFGPAWRALSWKSLVVMSRKSMFWMMIFFFLLAVVIWLGAVLFNNEPLLIIMATILGMFSMFFAIIAPEALAIDFRGEMDQLEIIKTFPLSSRQVFFTLTLTCTAVVAMFQWGAMILSLATFYGKADWQIPPLILGLAGLVGLPTITFTSVVVENTLMLWLPAWFVVVKKKAGIEQMGRMIIVGISRILGITLLMLIPGAVGFLAFLLGSIWFGVVFFPVAVIIGAICLLVEVVLLGGNIAVLYEKLEPGGVELT